jgi:hypothetical protein
VRAPPILPACVGIVRPDLGSAAPDCVPDPRGFWCMGPHIYGQYLHILMPAGSDDSHDGPQPWEGITGRVKQETNKLLGVIERSNTANKAAITGVETKLEEATKGVEAKLEANKEAIKGVEIKLDSQQSQLQTKLESIEALLASLVAEKQ